VTHTYIAGLLIPLLAGGIVIALLGALLPAGWAARTRTATALRTEEDRAGPSRAAGRRSKSGAGHCTARQERQCRPPPLDSLGRSAFRRFPSTQRRERHPAWRAAFSTCVPAPPEPRPGAHRAPAGAPRRPQFPPARAGESGHRRHRPQHEQSYGNPVLSAPRPVAAVPGGQFPFHRQGFRPAYGRTLPSEFPAGNQVNYRLENCKQWQQRCSGLIVPGPGDVAKTHPFPLTWYFAPAVLLCGTRG
jgi:hypothetical protein